MKKNKLISNNNLDLEIKKNYLKILKTEKIKLIKEIYISHKSYYDCFSKDKKKIFKIINSFLISKYSDISNNYLIYCEKKLVGFISYFKSEEYRKRLYQNILITQNLLNKKDANDSLKKIYKLQKNFDSIPVKKKYYYLSRILIFKKFRKKRIASNIMQKIFIDKKIYLHVKKNNKTALLFYKENFKIIQNDKKYFLLCSK